MNNVLFGIDGASTRTYSVPCSQMLVGGVDYTDALRTLRPREIRPHRRRSIQIRGHRFRARSTSSRSPAGGQSTSPTAPRSSPTRSACASAKGLGVLQFHGTGGDYLEVTAAGAPATPRLAAPASGSLGRHLSGRHGLRERPQLAKLAPPNRGRHGPASPGRTRTALPRAARQRHLRHRQLLGWRLGTHPHLARLPGAGHLQRRFRRHSRPSRRQRLPRRSDGAGAHHLRRHVAARVRGSRERFRRRTGRHGKGHSRSRPMPASSADPSKTPRGRKDAPIFDIGLATERVAAAVDAARKLPFPFTLTARAENYLHGRPDLDDTIRRLQAFETRRRRCAVRPWPPGSRGGAHRVFLA